MSTSRMSGKHGRGASRAGEREVAEGLEDVPLYPLEIIEALLFGHLAEEEGWSEVPSDDPGCSGD